MDHRDHVELLRPGVEGSGARWADIGSGSGAFTLALADLLGPAGRIVSVDRDAAALHEQRREMERRFPAAVFEYRVADFTSALHLPTVDGIVFANSLHFVRDQECVLGQLVGAVRPGGRVILVEYDADEGNRWVPYPISLHRWRDLAGAVGLENAREIGRRPSRFLGSIYSAAADRAGMT